MPAWLWWLYPLGALIAWPLLARLVLDYVLGGTSIEPDAEDEAMSVLAGALFALLWPLALLGLVVRRVAFPPEKEER